MYNTELMQRILQSPAAWDVLSELAPIYGEARVALWLFQVTGAELDNMRQWTQETMEQVLPHTATWSLDYWEDEYALPRDPSLTTQQRRDRILAYLRVRAPMNPHNLALVASAAAGGAACRILERTGKPSVFTLVVTDFYPSRKGEAKIRAAVDRAKQARLSYLIRYEQYASGNICAYAAGAVTGAAGKIKVVITGRIMPHPSTIKGYAAAAASGSAGRASVTIKGKISPQTVAVRGYAAVCRQSSAGSVVVPVKGEIKPQPSPIKGYAKVQAVQSVQRIEVTVQ